MFHIDHHAVDLFVLEQTRQIVNFCLDCAFAHRHVAGAIRQHNQQRLHIRMQGLFSLDHFISHLQPRRQRRLAAHWDVGQSALRQQNRVGGGQHQRRPVFLEDYQANPVTPLVGIGEQRENGAFGGLHALSHSHAPGTVHQKENQVGSLFDAHFFLEIIPSDGKSDVVFQLEVFPRALVRRRSPQRGIKS